MAKVPDQNPNWVSAYQKLADAADLLDAMLARASLQAQGQNPNRPVWPTGPVPVAGSGT